MHGLSWRLGLNAIAALEAHERLAIPKSESSDAIAGKQCSASQNMGGRVRAPARHAKFIQLFFRIHEYLLVKHPSRNLAHIQKWPS